MKKFLLDTHTFIWWITDSASLSPKVRTIIEEPKNTILFSVVSAWEIAIKAKLGRLTEIGDPEKTVPENLQKNNFTVLAINLESSLKTYSIERYHEDPFDRLLVAQSLLEDAPIISKDPIFKKYGVEIIW